MVMSLRAIHYTFGSGIPGCSLVGAAGKRIDNRSRRDLKRLTIGARDRDRVLLGGNYGLQRVMDLAQMDRMAPDIADFENEVSPECSLQRQIPLLHARNNKVARHL